ncbi:MAG TPA: CapA family protein [Acetobacteraceae bacterium]|jgi:poly-gamma-glutamate synthesis protein (capsule biosynthesis protein)
MPTLILTGDVNLMNVDDPTVPFARVRDTFAAADLVFSNLECCLYQPPQSHSFHNEGFFADPAIGGEALRRAGIAAVGIANNVNYGEAAILASIAQLDALGIPHTGAGANVAAARAPVLLSRGGLRWGFLQRSSVYWPTNHEAGPHDAGIAVIRGHTAYQVPMHKIRPEIPPMNRPGIPPVVVTWADPDYLRVFAEDVAALRAQADVVVASCHWGLHKEVLAYMRDIAHAAIDAGADVVIGHGPHYSLPIEVYRGKPIYYGLGSFSFHTGHGGRAHGDWIGMMAQLRFDGSRLAAAGFHFVRHNARNETVLCSLDNEATELADIVQRSIANGARLSRAEDAVSIALQ